MSRATYPPKMPTSIKREAARLAKQDGVSLNLWIVSAVARKIGAVETAEEFFNTRAAGHTGEGLAAILATIPDRGPDPEELK